MPEVTFASPTDGANPPEPAAQITESGDRPEWLPPNFKSGEDLAKSYAELQAKATRDAQELARLKGTAPAAEGDVDASNKPSEGGENKAPDDKSPTQDDAAKQAADKAGIDLSPYSQEFAETGDVSPENRAKIIEGFKKAFPDLDWDTAVNEYIEGKKALAANDRAMFMEAAGGEEQYSSMIQWAAQALPKADVEAYNRQIASGDRHATLFAIEGLRAKYEKANGRVPNRIDGAGGSPNAVIGFRSTAEMTRAMRDPRYQTDPSYREEVKAKLRVSNL